MKLLYIVDYNLSFFFTEIQFSQCTNAFVLYVFCMTNQHNKDVAEYYSRRRFFPHAIQKWGFQLPTEERWYVFLLCACGFLVAAWESARAMSDSSLLKPGS